MKISNNKCPLCNKPVSIKYAMHPGYILPDTYDIMYCKWCDTAYSSPLEVNEKLYDLIYNQGASIPGYQRYLRYAHEVLSEEDPLAYLSGKEDVYWAVNNFLCNQNLNDKDKILEVGCGLGYLTYAIAKKGYDITGLDISNDAIQNAIKKYGNNYLAEDLFEHSEKNKERYNVIIMTEVIEHVPNIMGFMKALDRLLSPGGTIILTTPNKSSFNKNMLWDTELPPIHLYWLSENSIIQIARNINYNVEFTDFSEYNRLHENGVNNTIWFDVPIRNPVLDTNYRLITGDKECKVRPKSVYKDNTNIYSYVLSRIRKYFRFNNTVDAKQNGRSLNMCAIMKKIFRN